MRPCQARGAQCPSIDTLARLLNDALPIERRVAVLKLAAECERCGELLKLGNNLKAWSPDLSEDLALADGGLPESRSRRGLSPFLVGMVIAFSFCVALFLFSWMTHGKGDPGFFSRQRISDLPASAQVYPVPGVRLLNAPDRLLWAQGAQVERERSVQIDAAGFVRNIEVTRPGLLRFPDDLRLPDGAYQWRVLDHNAQAIHGPYSFEIKR